MLALALPYPEHLSPTYGAYTLSCRPPILHSYGFGVLHFPFGTAPETICLHRSTSFSTMKVNYSSHNVNSYTDSVLGVTEA